MNSSFRTLAFASLALLAIETAPAFSQPIRPLAQKHVVVGESPAMQARVLTRGGFSDWREESLFETDLPCLVNSTAPGGFDF